MTITPVQFERNKKFESIFIPQAMSRRNQILNPKTTESARFVHYTSAEAALKIINQKRLWMRNTVCMTDYREVQHGFAALHKFFSDKVKANSFKSVVNEVSQGAADEAIASFDEWWKSGVIQFNTFIASVSEHDVREDFHGRLSMWRAFGGNTARVALVFNVPSRSDGATALNINFSPVPQSEVAAMQSPVTLGRGQSRLVAPGRRVLGKKDCLFFEIRRHGQT